MKRQSLKAKMKARINRSRRLVFLRSDFEDLGGYDQVGRVLRLLIAEGTVIKFGYGLYAKARPNRLTGSPMLAAVGGFNQVVEEALKRLGVKWERSDATKAYQAGSTQIPANAQCVVYGRFNRRIGTDTFELRVVKA